MPVIPLVGTAFDPVPNPARGTISKDTINTIADDALKRLSAIKGPLLEKAPAAWLLKLMTGMLCSWPARFLVRGKIVDALTEALAPDVKG